MNTLETLGLIWVLTATAFGTWTILKLAYRGYKRDELLHEKGAARERDEAFLLRSEQR